MLEESISSSSATFWSSLTSWFTPTIFFLLLQLVIATIYIISSLSHNHNKHQHQHEQHPLHETNHLFQHQQQPPLARSPSLLHRLKSINFYYHPHTSHETQQHHHQQQQLPQQQHQQQPQILRSPSSVLQRLKSINFYSYLPTEPLSSYFSTDTHNTNDKPHVRETETVPTPIVQTHQRQDQRQEQEEHQEEEEEGEEEEDDVVGEISNYNNLGLLHGHEDEGSFSNSSMDEIFSKLQQGQGGNFTRTHSDTKPASGEVPVKLPRKMRKSASTKSAFSHFEEADIVESRRPATAKEGGGGVASTAAEEDGGVDAKADDFINRFKQQLKLQRLDSIMRYKEMIGRGGGK